MPLAPTHPTRRFLAGWDYTVDDDIAHHELPTLRNAPGRKVRDRIDSNAHALPNTDLDAEVAHLREYGIDDENRFARFVGLDPTAYRKRKLAREQADRRNGRA